MKNKKFKLFASLTSLVMVVAVMAVGVWAATNVTASVSGTVSYSSTGFTANYQVQKDGANVIATTPIGAANATPSATDVAVAFTTGEDGTVADVVLTFAMTGISIEEGNTINHTLTLDNAWTAVQGEENTYTNGNVQAVIASGSLQGTAINSTITFSVIDVSASVQNVSFTITDTYTATTA